MSASERAVKVGFSSKVGIQHYNALSSVSTSLRATWMKRNAISKKVTRGNSSISRSSNDMSNNSRGTCQNSTYRVTVFFKTRDRLVIPVPDELAGQVSVTGQILRLGLTPSG